MQHFKRRQRYDNAMQFDGNEKFPGAKPMRPAPRNPHVAEQVDATDLKSVVW